jgi:hypothetical protein
MKHKLLITIALGLLVLNSCTKKETIIQEYNPPQPSLYGTWKMLNQTSSDTSYYVFNNDGTNFMYLLSKSSYGFKSSQGYVYKATDKQLQVYSSLFNYKVSNDTLYLMESPSTTYKLLKMNNSGLNTANWLSASSMNKSMNMPRGTLFNTRPFAIEGNYLYLYGNDNSNERVYKFNHTTELYEDSGSVSEPASTCIKAGNLYTAFDNGNYNIYKSSTSSIGSMSIISNNTLPYANTISINPNSGVIYAYCNDNKIYTGTENSTFNELFDFSPYGINNVLYYKNDEFLCIRNSTIHKIVIAPSFKVITSYQPIPNFSIYQLSTNGTDVWCYGYDNTTGTYKLVKLTI